MLGVIKGNYGDVIKFLGDAVLIMWPVELSSHQDVKAATALMASLCALQLLKDCAEYDRGEGQNAVSLKLHCGIGSGLVYCMCVGEGERWEFFISGDPLQQLAEAVPQAKTGEVCLSEVAYRLVRDKLDGKLMPNGSYLLSGKCAVSSPEKDKLRKEGNFSRPLPLREYVETESKATLSRATSGADISDSNRSNSSNVRDMPHQPYGTILKRSSSKKGFGSPDPSVGTLLRKSSSKSLISGTGAGDSRQPSARGTMLRRDSSRKMLMKNLSEKGMLAKSLSNQSIKEQQDEEEEGGGESVSKTLSISTSDRSKNTPANSTHVGRGTKVVPMQNDLEELASESKSVNSVHKSVAAAVASNLSFAPNGAQIHGTSSICVALNEDGPAHILGTGKSGLESDMKGMDPPLAREAKPQSSSPYYTNGKMDSNEYKKSIETEQEEYSNRAAHISSSSQYDDTPAVSQAHVDSKVAPSTLTAHSSSVAAIRISRSSSGGSNDDESGMSVVAPSVLPRPIPVVRINPATNPTNAGPVRSLAQVGRAFSRAWVKDPFEYLEENPSVYQVQLFLKGFLWDDLEAGMDEREEHREPGSGRGDAPAGIEFLSATVLRLFVHESPRAALEGSATRYIFELRNVTTIFIQLLGLDEELDHGELDKPQKVISITLQCLSRFGGSLRQFTVDDKGCVIIASFGVPGFSHEDNCLRAVETCLSIRKKLEAAKMSCKAGVAEGRVYCGLVGGPDRCEYAMMGSPVNLAARLMGQCQPGDILVNNSVHEACLSAFVFQSLPAMTVKGYDQPVPVFKPIERACSSNVLLAVQAAGDGGFIGREIELEMLERAFHSYISSMRMQCFKYLIDGAPSVGKTRLVVESLNRAKLDKINLKTLIGAGSAAQISTPYHVVRQIIEQMMELQVDTDLNNSEPTDNNVLTSPEVSSHGAFNNISSLSVRGPPSAALEILKWILHNSAVSGGGTLDLASLPDFAEDSVQALGASPKRMMRMESFLSEMGGQTTCDDESHWHAHSSHGHQDFPLVELIPLLGVVLGKKIRDTRLTANLHPTRRRQLTDAFVLRLLIMGLQDKIDIILIDSLQWCDRQSTRILLRFVYGMKRGIFLGTCRAITETGAPQLQSVKETAPSGNTALASKIVERKRRAHYISTFKSFCTNIKINPLDTTEIKILLERIIGRELMQQKPGVLSDANVRKVVERSGGSPFHAAVLAAGLKNALKAGKFYDIQELPAGAHDVIVERFDELKNDNQVVLKTASAIGFKFSVPELKHALDELHFHRAAADLNVILEELLSTNLIRLVPEDSEAYTFSDRSVQESIYNLMLESQRAQAHGIVAAFLEHRYGEDVRHISDIARHYASSCLLSKKMYFMTKAADAARKDHSYYDAYRDYCGLVKELTGKDVTEVLDYCQISTNETYFLSIKQKVESSSCLPLLCSIRLHSKRRVASYSIPSQIYPTEIPSRSNGWILGDSLVRPIAVKFADTMVDTDGATVEVVSCLIVKIGLVQYS